MMKIEIMNNNKETERTDLHKTIWRIARRVENGDIVARQAELRAQIDAIVADLEGGVA